MKEDSRATLDQQQVLIRCGVQGIKNLGKWMMLDIAAARKGFKNKTISDIGFVRSSQNIADGLTKSMAKATVRETIDTGCTSVTPGPWIIRH